MAENDNRNYARDFADRWRESQSRETEQVSDWLNSPTGQYICAGVVVVAALVFGLWWGDWIVTSVLVLAAAAYIVWKRGRRE